MSDKKTNSAEAIKTKVNAAKEALEARIDVVVARALKEAEESRRAKN